MIKMYKYIIGLCGILGGYILTRIGVFGRKIIMLQDIGGPNEKDFPYETWIFHNHIYNKNYILFNRYGYWIVDYQYHPIKEIKGFSIRPMIIMHLHDHARTTYQPNGGYISVGK